jgi:S1-C subfamily serine protease
MHVGRKIIRVFLAGAASIWLTAAVRGDEPATRPALEELNREVRQLYGQAQAGLIRVQLPPPQWLNSYTLEPLNKYQQIDPAMVQRLMEQMRVNALNQGAQNQLAPNQVPQDQAIQNSRVYANTPQIRSQNDSNITQAGAVGTQSQWTQSSSTQPSSAQPGTIIIVSPPSQQAVVPNGPGGPLQMNVAPQADFVPTYIGLVLDDQGHVLVPIYVERETCASQQIRLAQPNGQIAQAKFLGSDRQTNVTILQVAGAAGQPMPLGDRIDPGSVCLFVSPSDGSARLGVWTGGDRDWGYVLATDGHVAGVARGGHILSGTACRLIAGEIEHYGVVRRPTLGVAVREMILIDAAKNQRMVMRVENVLPESPAEKAGLQPGDFLQSVRGQPVCDISSLAAAMTACDGKTELQILRNDESMTLFADLVLPTPDTAVSKQSSQQLNQK